MVEILLPEKEVFDSNVSEISKRIDSMSESNTMARLLHSNFKNWLSSSSMSPVKLTQDLDADKNGVISGDEFAELLGKMTGERPPEWVVELVFSFVKADVNRGIPISDWMAFLAASGLEVPDEMFAVPVIITGSMLIDPLHAISGQSITITASFNEPVDAYEIRVANMEKGTSESFTTAQADMDAPVLDEFILEADEAGEYRIELLHMGVRLDEGVFQVEALPEPEESPEIELEEDEVDEESETMPPPSTTGFQTLVDTLHGARLRSETQHIIEQEGHHHVRCTVLSSARTLLGEGPYRNGSTLTCLSEEGTRFELMMLADEREFDDNSVLEAAVAPHQWSLALRQLVCREV